MHPVNQRLTQRITIKINFCITKRHNFRVTIHFYYISFKKIKVLRTSLFYSLKIGKNRSSHHKFQQNHTRKAIILLINPCNCVLCPFFTLKSVQNREIYYKIMKRSKKPLKNGLWKDLFKEKISNFLRRSYITPEHRVKSIGEKFSKKK